MLRQSFYHYTIGWGKHSRMGVILLIRYRNHLRNECIYVRRINCVRLQYFQWHGKINFHLKVLCCGYGLLHRDKKQNVVICHSWLKNCWGFCNFFRRPNLVYEFFSMLLMRIPQPPNHYLIPCYTSPISSLRKEYKTATLAVKQRGIKKPSWFF